MKIDPTTIALCPCGSQFFKEEIVCMVSFILEGQPTTALSAPMFRCVVCSKFLDTVRNTDVGQLGNIRRYVLGALPEDLQTKPSSAEVDLNEISGTKRKLFRRIT